MRVAGALVAAALLLAACGDSARDGLRFDYQARSPEGSIEQTLTIVNPGSTAVAPTLKLTALDRAGDPLPGVVVRGAFGSERGGLVVPPRTGVLDILRFEGPAARTARDIDVRVVRADEVAGVARADVPEVQRLDARGREIGYGEPIESIRVRNAEDEPIRIRIALLEFDTPPPGTTQQAFRITRLAMLLELRAGVTKTIKLPRRMRGRIGSVKAYFSR